MQTQSTKRRRQSVRLPGYDYAQTGAYFITIVTQNRICLLGNIIDDQLILSDAGHIVQSVWKELPEHFAATATDTFVVMPNHVHGIIHIGNETKPVGAQHAAPSGGIGLSRSNVRAGSLGAIVRSLKSAVTKRYNEKHAPSGFGLWQRNYYEHVIRDENSLIRIREYIATNPARWSIDPENPFATRQVRAQHAAPLPTATKYKPRQFCSPINT
jgi:putative transposase